MERFTKQSWKKRKPWLSSLDSVTTVAPSLQYMFLKRGKAQKSARFRSGKPSEDLEGGGKVQKKEAKMSRKKGKSELQLYRISDSSGEMTRTLVDKEGNKLGRC